MFSFVKYEKAAQLAPSFLQRSQHSEALLAFEKSNAVVAGP